MSAVMTMTPEKSTPQAALGISRGRWIEVTRVPSPHLTEKMSPAWRRFEQFLSRDRHTFIHLRHLASELGVSQRRLLEATEGKAFRRDFGRWRYGRIVIFFYGGLRRWALGGAA